MRATILGRWERGTPDEGEPGQMASREEAPQVVPSTQEARGPLDRGPARWSPRGSLVHLYSLDGGSWQAEPLNEGGPSTLRTPVSTAWYRE